MSKIKKGKFVLYFSEKLRWVYILWRFIVIFKYSRKPRTEAEFGIIVSPWFNTPVPLYSILLGSALSKQSGVLFILDDSVRIYVGWWGRFQTICLQLVLKINKMPYIKVGGKKYRKNQHRMNVNKYDIRNLGFYNRIHKNRGESNLSDCNPSNEEMITQLSLAAEELRNSMCDLKLQTLISPGGIFRSSGIFRSIAKEFGWRFASYDSGEGVVLLSSDGVASQLSDVRRSVERNAQLEEFSINYISSCVNKDHKKRMNGLDHWNTQVVDHNCGYTYNDKYVLICLNVSWDSAALGLHRIFESSIEWVKHSVHYILESSDLSVVVRQHPLERFDYAVSIDNYDDILHREFGDNKRIKFIGCMDPVSTYSLIDNSNFMISYASTIGIEGIIRKTPVINVSQNYYADAGVTFDPKSLEEYHQILELGFAKGLSVDQGKIRNAESFYFFSQINNWNFTNFAPNNFLKNLNEGMEIDNDESTNVMVESLTTGEPLPYLRAKRIFNNKDNVVNI
jgi:hypothetical protein